MPAGLTLNAGVQPAARGAVDQTSTRTSAIGSYLVVARSLAEVPAARPPAWRPGARSSRPT